MQSRKVPAASQSTTRTLRDIMNRNKLPLSKYINTKVASSDKNMTYFSKLRRIVSGHQVYMDTLVHTEDNTTVDRDSSPIRNVSAAKIVPQNQKNPAFEGRQTDGLSNRRISNLVTRQIRNQIVKKRAVTNVSYAASIKKYKTELINYGKYTRVPGKGDPDQDRLICEQWGKVELLDMLGSGANAVVREACCHGDKYAVKIYEKYKLVEPKKRKRVYTEIELLRSIPQHPNIIRMYEAFEDKRQIHVIFEHMGESMTLNQYFRNNLLQLEQKQVHRIFGRIAKGVRHLHQYGIAHRDLKPDNVLITQDSEGKQVVKIIDFGFATVSPKADLHCGTPNFMAPELLDKAVKYHPLSVDMWALGVTLFYLLEARYPFKGYDEKDLFRQIRAGKYEFRKITNDLVKQLIGGMLQVDPSNRITAEQLMYNQWMLAG